MRQNQRADHGDGTQTQADAAGHLGHDDPGDGVSVRTKEIQRLMNDGVIIEVGDFLCVSRCVLSYLFADFDDPRK